MQGCYTNPVGNYFLMGDFKLSGRKQHFIPQHFQQPFAINGSKSKIWLYRKGKLEPITLALSSWFGIARNLLVKDVRVRIYGWYSERLKAECSCKMPKCIWL